MLTERQKRLNERYMQYLEAEKAVLTGQSYMIGNRQLTRANLASIRAGIAELESQGAPFEDEMLTGVSVRQRQVVFMD